MSTPPYIPSSMSDYDDGEDRWGDVLSIYDPDSEACAVCFDQPCGPRCLRRYRRRSRPGYVTKLKRLLNIGGPAHATHEIHAMIRKGRRDLQSDLGHDYFQYSGSLRRRMERACVVLRDPVCMAQQLRTRWHGTADADDAEALVRVAYDVYWEFLDILASIRRSFRERKMQEQRDTEDEKSVKQDERH